MKIDPRLVELLVCPSDHAELRLEEDADELICSKCGYAYPIRDGIPVMLVDEARKPGSGR